MIVLNTGLAGRVVDDCVENIDKLFGGGEWERTMFDGFNRLLIGEL